MGRSEALGQILRAFGQRVLAELAKMLNQIRRLGPGHIQIWIISALLGSVVGLACYGFITGMKWVERAFYRAETNNLLYWVHDLPWWWIVLVPTFGGFLTGQILTRFIPDGRARSISHVIESAALTNGRVNERYGYASALGSFVTLSMGGSTGQEGPLVHLGSTLSTRLSKWLNADGHTSRDFMACAAAAAIGASFNAPIAGILFAYEIILRHLSISSFAPIAISAVMGTIMGHWANGGDFVQVKFFDLQLMGYAEIPAFLLLGLVSGLVAVFFVRMIFVAEDTGDLIQERLSIPNWARPTIAGFLLGVIALGFPHIIGVGYQTMIKALLGNLSLSAILILVFVKVLAVCLTIGGKMGGGIFSPSLMIGAMTGLGFGIVATSVSGEVGFVQLYALAGMAAVSAAVLGAPLSTALIILEMTQDWQAALVVFSAVSVATGVSNRLLDKSFFLTQLERRGLHIAAGPQAYLLATFKVSAYMRSLTLTAARIEKFKAMGAYIYANESFEEAMPKFESLDVITLIVLSSDDHNAPIGQLDYLDVLRAYSHALADTNAEQND